MSIFGIIGIAFFISLLIWFFVGVVPIIIDGYDGDEDKQDKHLFVVTIFSIIFLVAGIFIGIGINTENEKVYVQKYLAQKQTIEMSLASEELTGLERVQLVTKATELNGEFAEKKARFNLWHFVVYDNTIYDGVELIDLNGDSVQNKGN